MRWRVALSLLLATVAARPQTAQGVILGVVVDALTGIRIPNAQVRYVARVDKSTGVATVRDNGSFVFPLLSPGSYRISVEADGYQPQDLEELSLEVASFLELRFQLRRTGDVWERGVYRSVLSQGRLGVVTMVGPDLDRSRTIAQAIPRIPRGGMEAAVSTVIPSLLLQGLPLAGRDAYSLLVMHSGVTNDAGTARGLGLSANGQRPSATNFLLDGVESNNYVTTGPVAALAPEAIGEYRISSAGFSAEYGRASGLIANAITRRGSGDEWHGTLYHYGKHEKSNANEFQRNRQGLPRARLRERQPGASVAGPIRGDSLILSLAGEWLGLEGAGDPVTMPMPVRSGYRSFSLPNRISYKLLEEASAILPVPISGDRALVQPTTFEPPTELTRSYGLVRVDKHFAGGRYRLLTRAIGSRLERPHFVWTPYPGFSSTLRQTTWSPMAGFSGQIGALTLETRVARIADDVNWDRPYAGTPTLAAPDVLLPGSPAFYAYRNRSPGIQADGSVSLVVGAHLFKVGGGVLSRVVRGNLTAGRDGRLSFSNLLDFYLDAPSRVELAVGRDRMKQPDPPDYNRRYGLSQRYVFAQDSWRVRPHLTLNLGVRYDWMGAPVNRGDSGDWLVTLGPGPSLAGRVAGASLSGPVPVGRPLFPNDRNDWGARLGFSFSPHNSGRTILSGAYGIFYDRPFDNLWQNLRSNAWTLAAADLPFSVDTPYTGTNLRQLAQGKLQPLGFPEVLVIPDGLRSPVIHSAFARLERRLGADTILETSLWTSLGRALVTTDRVNRVGEWSPDLPVIVLRANQGKSAYSAAAISLRWQTPGFHARLAYTIAQSHDNQSEPLAGDFFDLTFTRTNFRSASAGIAAFSRAGDPASDWARSDFEQRHNLAMYGLWELPGPFRGWSLGGLAAVRGGFPFTVQAGQEASFEEVIYNGRARLLRKDYRLDRPTEGGRVLLDSGAFGALPPGQLGSSPRNGFRGPGMISADVSLSRHFSLNDRLGFTLRLDAFNILNHANLNPPAANLGGDDFGVALFGRKGREAGFPALVPLDETARRLQLLLRFRW